MTESNIRRRHPDPIIFQGGNQTLPAAVAETVELEPTDDYAPFRDQVRALIRDGQPSYATVPYGLVRQEGLSDQVMAQATPTGTVFYVRWSSVPLGKNMPVTAVPLSIACYVDSATIPATIGNGGVTSDIDTNGNFTLAHPPTRSLLVSYGWQVFADNDLNQLLEGARSWLQGYPVITAVPDGLFSAITYQAAAQACESIGRALNFPDVTAGEAKESLSAVAKGYLQSAKDFYARADKARADFYTTGDEPLRPEATIIGVNYPVWQPFR